MEGNEGKQPAQTFPLSSWQLKIYYSNKGPWEYLAPPTHFTDEKTKNQKQGYGYSAVDLGPEPGPQLPISCPSHYLLKLRCRRRQDAISTQPSHWLPICTPHSLSDLLLPASPPTPRPSCYFTHHLHMGIDQRVDIGLIYQFQHKHLSASPAPLHCTAVCT